MTAIAKHSDIIDESEMEVFKARLKRNPAAPADAVGNAAYQFPKKNGDQPYYVIAFEVVAARHGHSSVKKSRTVFLNDATGEMINNSFTLGEDDPTVDNKTGVFPREFDGRFANLSYGVNPDGTLRELYVIWTPVGGEARKDKKRSERAFLFADETVSNAQAALLARIERELAKETGARYEVLPESERVSTTDIPE